MVPGKPTAAQVTGSGCFQGYAKMLSEVGSRSTDVFWAKWGSDEMGLFVPVNDTR